jgi:hypothetical protein
MADGDLLLSALAAGLLRNQTAAQTQTQTGGSTATAQISDTQLAALAAAVRAGVADGVAGIEIPAPQVTVTPADVSFPENLSVRFTDDELAKIAAALQPSATATDIKSQVYQRSILIDIGTATVPDSTFVNAEFPAGVRVASFNFQQQAGLIGVTLSASLVNTFTKPCGFFAALADSPRLNFDTTPYTTTAQVGSAKTPDSQILLSVFTHQNSTPTTINPNTRAAAISFGLDNAVTIVNSQSTLSLYAFQTINPATGLGQTGQLMSAILTAYYIPIETTGG